MQFDDRLATVLRMQAGSERAARTQFRQLLDLAGSAPEAADGELLEAAYVRLGALSAEIPAEERAAMVREPGQRLRNPAFLAFLASQELPVATAAVGAARLGETQWLALIPALPVPVRSQLRQRQDLPEKVRRLLARLGVRDLGLPEPGVAEVVEAEAREPATEPVSGPPPAAQPEDVLEIDAALEVAGSEDHGGELGGIGALVRRIEAFRRARTNHTAPARSADAPRLPLGEQGEDAVHGRLASFDFHTDAEGRITWADAAVAPMVSGIALASRLGDAPARADASTIAAIRRNQPVRGGRLVLEGAPAIAGEWRIDAAPRFSSPGGRFAGYGGRMRRPAAEEAAAAPAQAEDSAADRMRQVIHELRTPVNAIQVASEIIQQQLYGPAPHEYRALAAAIAGDAARMLAGFDELDRLVKLECGAIELDEGCADFAPIVAGTVKQLDAVLRPRSAGLELIAPHDSCPVALVRNDAEVLAWRILATVTGAVSPGEALQVVLCQNGKKAGLEVDLPASLASRDDIFESTVPAQAQAVSAGMFGAGFTLRLARAEARAAGGDLYREEDLLVLILPLGKARPAREPDNDVDLDGEIADTA